LHNIFRWKGYISNYSPRGFRIVCRFAFHVFCLVRSISHIVYIPHIVYSCYSVYKHKLSIDWYLTEVGGLRLLLAEGVQTQYQKIVRKFRFKFDFKALSNQKMDEKCFNCGVKLQFQINKGKKVHSLTNEMIRFFGNFPSTSGNSTSEKVCLICWSKYNNAERRGSWSQILDSEQPGPSGVSISPATRHNSEEQVSIFSPKCFLLPNEIYS